jgi:hypothetical protein
MLTGYITRGTTIHGKTVDAGQVVEVNEDVYASLRLHGNIAPLPEKPVEPEAEPVAKTKTPKKK